MLRATSVLRSNKCMYLCYKADSVESMRGGRARSRADIEIASNDVGATEPTIVLLDNFDHFEGGDYR